MSKVKVTKLKVRLSLLGRRKEGHLRRKRKLKPLRRKLVALSIMSGGTKDTSKPMVSALRSIVLSRWRYLIHCLRSLLCKLAGLCNSRNVLHAQLLNLNSHMVNGLISTVHTIVTTCIIVFDLA